jgi:outer membrane protein OmpA-like peptidoglycan-associated protein
MKSILCVPCWIAAGLLAAWVAASSYWYVCELKNLCLDNDRDMHMPTVVVPGTPATPGSTWANLSAQPLVVYFQANSDQMLTTDIASELTEIVAYMKAHPSAQILVTGHTNVHSSQSYTEQLGLTRANAAKAELVALGVSGDQIVTESKGQRELAASPATAEGRYLNRRVVISVVK